MTTDYQNIFNLTCKFKNCEAKIDELSIEYNVREQEMIKSLDFLKKVNDGSDFMAMWYLFTGKIKDANASFNNSTSRIESIFNLQKEYLKEMELISKELSKYGIE